MSARAGYRDEMAVAAMLGSAGMDVNESMVVSGADVWSELQGAQRVCLNVRESAEWLNYAGFIPQYARCNFCLRYGGKHRLLPAMHLGRNKVWATEEEHSP
jgi:hypothetical protein